MPSRPLHGLSAMNDIPDEPTQDRKSAKDAFKPGKSKKSGARPVLFEEDELDIYCNKMTRETYIFHSKELDYKSIKSMTYNHDTYIVDVHLKDGSVIDLGVSIQWMVRPYLSKAEEIQIVRTKDGEAIDGHFVPLKHVGEDV